MLANHWRDSALDHVQQASEDQHHRAARSELCHLKDLNDFRAQQGYPTCSNEIRLNRWPNEFKPHTFIRFDGSQNPKEFIRLYGTAIAAAKGDNQVAATYLQQIFD